MQLKLHFSLPGSEFSFRSKLEILPLPLLLNHLFHRYITPRVESVRGLSLQQARQHCLFDRGWLPQILPASTQEITCRICPALQCAQGRFCFKPEDWQTFRENLLFEECPDAPFMNWSGTRRNMKHCGYAPWRYPMPDREWLFFCNPEAGRCEFVVWATPPMHTH